MRHEVNGRVRGLIVIMNSEKTDELPDGPEPTNASDSSQKRLLESMGWLTESILIPRKGKAIEG